MKPNSLLFICGLGLLMYACQPNISNKGSNTGIHTITLSNPIDKARPDELVVFSRSELPDAPEGKVPVAKNEAGEIVPQQHDDLDQDGSWEELAVLLNFAPNEKKALHIDFISAAEMPDFPERTSVRLGVLQGKAYQNVQKHTRPTGHKPHDPLYHVEGPSWENDKVGFRTYFDERNGKDIFGKTVPEMVLDTVSLGSGYHNLHDWGMDILKVNNSLGAGALAIQEGEELIRLGATETAAFEIIKDGPVRSVFTLKYTGWEVGGQPLQVTETITMTPGNYYYQSSVNVTGFSGEKVLISGIVNLLSEELITDFDSPQYTAFATFDQQSFIEDGLGMGIMVRKADFLGAEQAPEEGKGITQTFYGKYKLLPNKPVSFYFVAAWETSDPQFSTREGFVDLINTYLEKLSHPISKELPKAVSGR